MHVFVVVFAGFVPLAVVVQKLVVLGDESFSNLTLSAALLAFFSFLLLTRRSFFFLAARDLPVGIPDRVPVGVLTNNNEFLGRS